METKRGIKIDMITRFLFVGVFFWLLFFSIACFLLLLYHIFLDIGVLSGVARSGFYTIYLHRLIWIYVYSIL